MVNKPFSQWLEDELRKRGWSAADLARRANLTTGAISHVLNGSRNPGPDFCRALARALNIPEHTVFYLAGLLSLPPNFEITPEEQQLLYHFQQLSPEEQEDILAYLRRRAERTAQNAIPGGKHAHKPTS